MLYSAACNFIYGSELGFVPRINFNDRFIIIIIVSILYFISQKENIDKMYLTTVTVVFVKQEAQLLSLSFGLEISHCSKDAYLANRPGGLRKSAQILF